jgi:DNA uptake protein ComE-like DNA-binding protein
VSTASAIDLAGSEDNRRTDNNKERLVESSSINKSLFVLAQCVEAISKKQARIPYRESKMTRILSLGQNDGITVMILNLAPVKSYHLDTLSSLNFANRTKRIEVNEVENEPIFRGPKTTSSLSGPTLNRQPLRPLTSTANIQVPEQDKKQKPVKSFAVYSDKSRPSMRPSAPLSSVSRPTQKRSLDPSYPMSARPMKAARPNPGLSKAEIEAMIDQRVNEKIAEKALNETAKPAPALSGDLQRRLDALEQRVADKEDSEGLQFLLMAKQHYARGEDSSALRMYQLAQPFFPRNDKLANKILTLQDRIRRKREEDSGYGSAAHVESTHLTAQKKPKKTYDSHDDDYDYNENQGPDPDADDSFIFKPKRKTAPKMKVAIFRDEPVTSSNAPPSPRTLNLLRIINTRDVAQIRALKGVGAKKAEAIVSSLCEMDELEENALVTDLEMLGCLKGVGSKTVENMRVGLAIAV